MVRSTCNSKKSLLGLMLAVLVGVIGSGGCVTADPATDVPVELGKCIHPWVFFDLGDTLITSPGPAGTDRLRWLPGAEDHVKNLMDRGYTLGLIINIPPEWGISRTQRLDRLKEVIQRHWDGPKFDWDLFGDRILLPATTAERKPAATLFDEARMMAAQMGCDAVFEGESQDEVDGAKRSGLNGWLVKGAGTWLKAP